MKKAFILVLFLIFFSSCSTGISVPDPNSVYNTNVTNIPFDNGGSASTTGTDISADISGYLAIIES